ncbi:winged helix DNA-binding domain-containing protein [Yinghuangia seranimata]|uniref:winged helix DNA-binding domain-containing protein n=1 Tax=Yinghuangia seranimata TaxID=408067 RepID=UPI00248BBF05|nr:winged helix DNA-binding domain-containing protein [Yinghuangia seranimata]MDI2126463.1 winged helix DNA-binding domain-containing protein [Yinghuangia seranimata]
MPPASSAPVRHIGVAERRARLLSRHLMSGAAAATSPEAVAGALVALHSTDPASVFLSVAARSTVPAADVERALYEDRTLVRMSGMRATVFVVPDALAATVQYATTAATAARARKDMLKLGQGDGTLDPVWLAEVEESVVRHLAGLPEATGAELSALEPRLRETLVYAVGTKWETPQAAGMRVLRNLAMDGRIARGRPKGGWTSSQYRWSSATPHPEVAPVTARTDLLRAWLAAFGPGTEADLKWWTGWTLTQVRAALAALGAVTVTVDGGTGAKETGYVLPEDVDPVPARAGESERAVLLPALDPTPMGWQQRAWYLDEPHRAPLFDRSGNIGPSVWWQGRIVGGWAQRADGAVVWRLFEDVGGAAEKAAAAEAARLEEWIGPVRVTPRFRTPIDKELTA